MPLRFLAGVAGIHLLPVIEKNYLQTDYLKGGNGIEPALYHYICFALVCCCTLFARDPCPQWGTSTVMIDDSRKETVEKMSTHYTLHRVPRAAVKKHWIRQLLYDLTVYVTPLVAIALATPLYFPQFSIISIVIQVIFVVFTFFLPVYSRLAAIFFLHVCI